MTDLSLFCWTVGTPDRLLKNAHLRRCTHPSSLRRTRKYASFLRISGAPANGISQGSTCICLPARSRFGEGRGIFEQPAKDEFFSKVLDFKDENYSENAPTEKRYHNKMLYLSLD
jgi:hypothetical protein